MNYSCGLRMVVNSNHEQLLEEMMRCGYLETESEISSNKDEGAVVFLYYRIPILVLDDSFCSVIFILVLKAYFEMCKAGWHLGRF